MFDKFTMCRHNKFGKPSKGSFYEIFVHMTLEEDVVDMYCAKDLVEVRWFTVC